MNRPGKVSGQETKSEITCIYFVAQISKRVTEGIDDAAILILSERSSIKSAGRHFRFGHTYTPLSLSLGTMETTRERDQSFLVLMSYRYISSSLYSTMSYA